MPSIDINCDLGEGFGPWMIGADDQVLPHITSANIACGYHAGDPGVMRRTVAAALEYDVAVGAHPGLPDMMGFGRRTMLISPEEAYDMVVYQTGALMAIAHTVGTRVHHVKPHGALYNMSAARMELAEAIAQAVHDVDPSLLLYGLAGSALVAAGERLGLHTVSEAFPDRGYAGDGTLLPRKHADAIVHDPTTAGRRAVRMAREGIVVSAVGTHVKLKAQTLCIHGDHARASETALAVRDALTEAGITVAAPNSA